MSKVVVKEGESLDSALKRFRAQCNKAGIQKELRKREYYRSPSLMRKYKDEEARKRNHKSFD